MTFYLAFISNAWFRNWVWFVLNWAPREAVWQSEALCPHQWLLHLTEYFARTARVAAQHHPPCGSEILLASLWYGHVAHTG